MLAAHTSPVISPSTIANFQVVLGLTSYTKTKSPDLISWLLFPVVNRQKDKHAVRDSVDKQPERAAARRGRERVMN